MQWLIYIGAVFFILLAIAYVPLHVCKVQHKGIVFAVFFFVLLFNTFFFQVGNMMFAGFSNNHYIQNPSRINAAVRLICPDDVVCHIAEEFNAYRIKVMTDSPLPESESEKIIERAVLYKEGYLGLDGFLIARITIEFWASAVDESGHVSHGKYRNESF
ncbi:MAG TPA: hypothetical protein VIM96_01100 [Pseudomonadales bacterium]